MLDLLVLLVPLVLLALLALLVLAVQLERWVLQERLVRRERQDQ